MIDQVYLQIAMGKVPAEGKPLDVLEEATRCLAMWIADSMLEAGTARIRKVWVARYRVVRALHRAALEASRGAA